MEACNAFIVQKFQTITDDHHDLWVDVAIVKATDAGAALHAAVVNNPTHRIEATTYRVSEEALLVNVSINLQEATANRREEGE